MVEYKIYNYTPALADNTFKKIMKFLRMKKNKMRIISINDVEEHTPRAIGIAGIFDSSEITTVIKAEEIR